MSERTTYGETKLTEIEKNYSMLRSRTLKKICRRSSEIHSCGMVNWLSCLVFDLGPKTQRLLPILDVPREDAWDQRTRMSRRTRFAGVTNSMYRTRLS